MLWSDELLRRFVDAVYHISLMIQDGFDKLVPKCTMLENIVHY